MAPQRLPITRIAGIVAWTAASVTWGTAIVATANAAPEPEVLAEGPEPEPIVIVEPNVEQVLAPVPAMPESGLVVLRYTPGEKPEPKIVVQRVVVASPSTGKTAPAATPTKAPAKAPAKVKSSGS